MCYYCVYYYYYSRVILEAFSVRRNQHLVSFTKVSSNTSFSIWSWKPNLKYWFIWEMKHLNEFCISFIFQDSVETKIIRKTLFSKLKNPSFWLINRKTFKKKWINIQYMVLKPKKIQSCVIFNTSNQFSVEPKLTTSNNITRQTLK